MQRKSGFTPLEKATVKGKSSLTGFTLMEIVMTITIIAILATTVIATYSGLTKKTRKDVATAELQLLLSAASAYRADYGTYPTTTGVIGAAHLLVSRGYISDPNAGDTDWTASQTTGTSTTCAFRETGKAGSPVEGLSRSIDQNGTLTPSNW